MAKKPDYVRLAGLALVAAAIALYVRDCRRTRVEQTALAAIRAAASDPGALVAFGAPDPANPRARIFRPVRDAAVASNIVAALAAAEPGWRPDPDSSARAEHYAMLLGRDRRSSFFLLVRDDSTDRVGVRLLPAPPPVGLPDGFPPMSAAGLDDILKRVESGELLDEWSGIRVVPVAVEPAPAGENGAEADAAQRK